MTRLGILHPGAMGISIAASASHNGHSVYWLSPARSLRTRERAEEFNLQEIDSMYRFCQICEMIISVCPPQAAEDLSHSVAAAGFEGLYLDANAISPQRAIRLGQMLEAQGIRFVDGGIIGGPAWKPGETWLYLSGEQAHRVTACFSDGPLETRIIGKEIGKASALKMCYAAYTKGTTALLAAILAAAESLDVREELYQHWEMDENGFSERVNQRTARAALKAWRFAGEMQEIASTLGEAGLPDGFHLAAAEIFHRMAGFKDSKEHPSPGAVLKALLTQ